MERANCNHDLGLSDSVSQRRSNFICLTVHSRQYGSEQFQVIGEFVQWLQHAVHVRW